MPLIVGPSATPPSLISYTCNHDLALAGGVVLSKIASSLTGAAGFGSSLFLNRINIPDRMNLTEVEAAFLIGFNATNQGAGTMSRSFAIYSFGNSTSLASVASTSGSSSWNTGTSTAGASSSLTQYQGGWSVAAIQPMTFASTSINPGEYVIGNLFDFAQASSNWTVSFYGMFAGQTTAFTTNSGLTSASLGALSSGGLAAVSALTATTSAAITAFSAAITALSLGKVASTASLITNTASLISATATAASTVSLLMNTGTGAFGVLSSAGLSAGSFIGTSGSIGAVTNVAITTGAPALAMKRATSANFVYIGTGSTTSNFPTVFDRGIMSTGGIPSAITVTSTAVTYSGSVAFQQPWFALVGS